MSGLCVLGYASLDHKYRTASFRGPGSTTLVDQPLHGPHGDPGAVAYFARAARRHISAVNVVSWVGADAAGRDFCTALSSTGVGVDGVVRAGGRSPSSHMFYPPSGEVVTFYDPGHVDTGLQPLQRACIRAAEALVIGVGPPAAITSALAAADDGTTVMWAVKADPGSLPADLATRLVERAQVITFSVTEGDFLRTHCGLDPDTFGSASALVVETHGADGVRYRHGTRSGAVPPTRRVDVCDQTGAGDTFAGSLMARLVRTNGPRVAEAHPDSVEDAVVGAGRDAAEFLIGRELGKN